MLKQKMLQYKKTEHLILKNKPFKKKKKLRTYFIEINNYLKRVLQLNYPVNEMYVEELHRNKQ